MRGGRPQPWAYDRPMVYSPGVGKTPNDWAEEEARRKESLARVSNPHGRSPTRATRLVIGWALGLVVIAAIVATVLGLFGVIDIFLPAR